MRVPSIGQPVDERRIVREGMRLAEHMLRNYRDRPTLLEMVRTWLVQCRQAVLGPYRG
jgi:hypothetical protein